MRPTNRVAAAAVLIAFAGLPVTCDKGPTRPTQQSGISNVPTPVSITSLVISGPGTIAPGATAQYAAVVLYSDGSSRDVTSEAVWRSGSESVLTISPSGLATAHNRGETSITVNASSRVAVKNEVIVVPAGTFRLAGTVRDLRLPVAGARVEVIGIPGLQALLTGSTGTYRFYGVSGDTEIRVFRNGYHEHRQRIEVTSHQTLDVDLILVRPRQDLSGTYTLTVTAAPECGAQLPDIARRRTYTAVLRQDGPRLDVTLEGAKFFLQGSRPLNTFRGTVDPNGVAFQLTEIYEDFYYFYYPDVLEELDPTTFLGVAGTVTATTSSSGSSGTLNGPVETLRHAPFGRLERIASCRSSGHQFVLSR
jgi:hypothetical protein